MQAVLEDYINTNQNGQRRNDGHGDGIGLQGSFDRYGARRSLELLQTKASESSSLPRVTSRRIAGSKRHLVIDAYTSNLGGVDGSGVISPRSGSCEGIYGLGRAPMEGKNNRFVDANGHRVANIDGDHISPWNRDLVERIYDVQAFIKYDHFRAYEDGNSDSREQGGPQQRCHAALNREVGETLIGIDRRGNDGDGREDRTTSWSEGHRISHAVIISRRDAR